MFFAQMGSNSTQTRGGRIAWLLARPKLLKALGIAAGRDAARRGEHLQQLEIARMQPKGKRSTAHESIPSFPIKARARRVWHCPVGLSGD